eukprot:gene821-118_t
MDIVENFSGLRFFANVGGNCFPVNQFEEQAVRRCLLQVYIWKRCCHENIDALSYKENGWKAEENKLIPNWFTGKQLPPTLAKKRLKKKIRNAGDADTKASESEDSCKRKRRRKNRGNPVKSSIVRGSLSAYHEDGDDEKDGNTNFPGKQNPQKPEQRNGIPRMQAMTQEATEDKSVYNEDQLQVVDDHLLPEDHPQPSGGSSLGERNEMPR